MKGGSRVRSLNVAAAVVEPVPKPICFEAGFNSSVTWNPGCRARGWEFDMPRCLVGEVTLHGLGQLHSPRMLSEEAIGKPLPSVQSLGNLVTCNYHIRSCDFEVGLTSE